MYKCLRHTWRRERRPGESDHRRHRIDPDLGEHRRFERLRGRRPPPLCQRRQLRFHRGPGQCLQRNPRRHHLRAEWEGPGEHVPDGRQRWDLLFHNEPGWRKQRNKRAGGRVRAADLPHPTRGVGEAERSEVGPSTHWRGGGAYGMIRSGSGDPRTVSKFAHG